MRRAAIIAGALAALAACGGGGEGNEANGSANGSSGNQAAAAQARSLGDDIAANGELAQFARALQAAGLADTLKGAEPYTLFAPVNAAFEGMPEAARTRLMSGEGRGELTELLTAHIVPGFVTARDLDGAIQRGQGRATLATVAGTNLTISRDGDAYVVSDAAGGRARIVSADGEASNGVIHGIDGILVPAAEAPATRQ
jgi:uncharacterized surface protein with fasciclin (FAS1) repeats